jgi:hypothetical protein
MHRTGKMTTEEYDAARKRLASRLASSMPTPAATRRPGADARPTSRTQARGGKGPDPAQGAAPSQSAQVPTPPPSTP